MGRVVIALLAALLLAGCGGGSDVLTAPKGEQAVSLERVEWQLLTMTESGRERDVDHLDAVLRFDGKGHVSGRGCNYFGGDADVSGNRIKAGSFSSTMMACGDQLRSDVDRLTTKALSAGATWSIADGRLTISGGGIDLVYKERDTVFPDRTATALVEGKIGAATYRLSWAAVETNVGVNWESREEPGTGFGSTGVGRPVDFDVTYLDPSAATVAGRAFVFVVAPLDVAALTFGPPGAEAVQLTSYDVPPAKTWRIWAGFVGSHSKGSLAIAYDANGRETMRSRVLPY